MRQDIDNLLCDWSANVRRNEPLGYPHKAAFLANPATVSHPRPVDLSERQLIVDQAVRTLPHELYLVIVIRYLHPYASNGHRARQAGCSQRTFARRIDQAHDCLAHRLCDMDHVLALAAYA